MGGGGGGGLFGGIRPLPHYRYDYRDIIVFVSRNRRILGGYLLTMVQSQ